MKPFPCPPRDCDSLRRFAWRAGCFFVHFPRPACIPSLHHPSQRPTMSPNYVSAAWSLRGGFDEEECRQQVVDNLLEHYNTIYACVFLAAAAAYAPGQQWQQQQQQQQQAAGALLITACHSGDMRLYNWRRVCGGWLASRTPQQHDLSWRAHKGPAYAAAVLPQSAEGPLLATSGDDGFLRIWRVSDICDAAAAAAAAATAAAAAAATADAAHAAGGDGSVEQLQPQQCSPSVLAELRLPHVSNQLGLSNGTQPAVQALAADGARQLLFAGASDGGVHVVDVAQLLSAAARGLAPALAAAAALAPLQGHAAGVLALDWCDATQQLASGSEDGTVRIWACANGGDSSSWHCTSLISPGGTDAPGAVLPLGDAAQQLQAAAAAPAVACVRWGPGGTWLVLGTDGGGASGDGAGTGGSIVLWNAGLGEQSAVRQLGKCMPQALLLLPGAILVAGTDGTLHRLSFLLEPVQAFDLDGLDSVFALAAQPGSGALLALGGARGCLQLLSGGGQLLGRVQPPASVLLSDGCGAVA